MTDNLSQIESLRGGGVDERVAVFGGVDTHLDFHVVAVVNAFGVLLATEVFVTTAAGYRDLLGWLRTWGPLTRVGVEGTGSYGAALTRHLHRHGVEVLEINRPDRANRRRRGKTDAYDAEAAARTAHSGAGAGTGAGPAKINHGPIEALRVLKLERDSAVKARTTVLNQLHQIRVTAPAELRDQITGLTKRTLPARCARFRVDTTRLHDPLQATKRALRGLSQRVLALTKEIDDLENDIAALVAAIAPRTLATPGAGPDTVAQLLITIGENPHRFRNEAAFAAICGVNPIPASSGKTRRHRLNRAGDRQANKALHMITLSRLAHHRPTRDYITARSTDGRSDPHLRRCLKRYLARQLFPLLRTDLQALNTPLDKS